MKFIKMQGCGNDYIYVNGFQELIADPSELAKKMSNRHFGVGSDGLVLILPSQEADFRMRMFNADGSESEMCGNALRCVGKYVFDRRLTDQQKITIETLAGIKGLELLIEDQQVKEVKVDMGEPILDANSIPVISKRNPVIDEKMVVENFSGDITCVSMGNPHAITFVEDVSGFNVEGIGKQIEINPIFPRKTNVEFVKVIHQELLEMRVWERGAGETLACGTGACASLVASVLKEVSNRQAVVQLLGGNLLIEWDQVSNHVFMTGPAEFVFEGQWTIEHELYKSNTGDCE